MFVRSVLYSENVELTSDQKGAIAESAIVHAAIKLGIGVLKPLTDGHRYDLVFDFDGQLARIQCKWASFHGDVLVVRAYSCRRSRNGLIKRAYSAEHIDAVAAYCLALDRCFSFPIDWLEARTVLQLRLRPTRNNQQSGINWADDFAFERLRFDVPGAIAQLGERLRGTQEVGGSSPPGSTHRSDPSLFDEPDRDLRRKSAAH